MVCGGHGLTGIGFLCGSPPALPLVLLQQWMGRVCRRLNCPPSFSSIPECSYVMEVCACILVCMWVETGDGRPDHSHCLLSSCFKRHVGGVFLGRDPSKSSCLFSFLDVRFSPPKSRLHSKHTRAAPLTCLPLLGLQGLKSLNLISFVRSCAANPTWFAPQSPPHFVGSPASVLTWQKQTIASCRAPLPLGVRCLLNEALFPGSRLYGQRNLDLQPPRRGRWPHPCSLC